MADRKKVYARLCKRCMLPIVTNAKGMQAHGENCIAR